MTIETTDPLVDAGGWYFLHCLDGINPAPGYQISIFCGGDRIIWAGSADDVPQHVRAIFDDLESANPHARSWARIKADFARARSSRRWP